MSLLNYGKLLQRKKILLWISITALLIYVLASFRDSEESFKLKNILEEDLTKKRNIFFVESSFNSTNGEAFLKNREICAVESAALQNPEAFIRVIFVSNATSISPSTKNSLATYKNVAYYKTDILEFTSNTPVEEWIKSGKFFNSTYLTNNISNLLRLLLLWRFGGTYLDLDVISLTSLESIPEKNFVYAQNNDLSKKGALNNAILTLDLETGREIAELMAKDFVKSYNGNVWGQNGPRVATSALRSYCNFGNVTITEPFRCPNLIIFPKQKAYEINWREANYFFKEKYAESTMERLKDSHFTHIWNKVSTNEVIHKNATSAYVMLAKAYCPSIFYRSGGSF